MLGVSLLQELGLDYIRLERQRDGHYRYLGWTTPLADNNGSPEKPNGGFSRGALIFRYQK
jgi:hypothetical protein